MKAAVLGYGKSGKAAENLLRLEGISDIDIFDDGNAEMPSIAEFRDIYDCVVVSPGVDMRKMQNAPADFTSEIELAHRRKPAVSKVVAVTGTNGKSTVTSLTAQILKKCGIDSEACGNIGLTYAEAVQQKKRDCYVVELSSFQTGMLKNFSADCVVITNLAEDHMDRYSGMEDYADDKMNLVRFLNKNGRLIIENEEYLCAKSSFFTGETAAVDPQMDTMPKLDNNILSFGSFFADISGFGLKGGHNLVNLAFALLAADSFCGFKGDVTPLVKGLTGLAHRCESVAVINGVEWINDSKGTNIHSTLTALKGFEKGVVVILGGKDKNGDFLSLKDVLNEKASCVVTYGDAGEKIFETLYQVLKVPLFRAEKLEDAVDRAYAKAKEGEKVVLSPACASFDQHRNFEHRGEHFKELVEKKREEADERA